MEFGICIVKLFTILTLIHNIKCVPIPGAQGIDKDNATSRILFHSGNGGMNNAETLPGDHDIVFPDSEELIYNPTKSPKCVRESTFCEDFESYPYHHLKNVLRLRSDLKLFFGDEEATAELTNRIGEPEDSFICKAVVKTIYPRYAKNRHNEWKVIINQKDKDGYIQGVMVEICSGENRPCDIIGDIPQGYKTSCKQKYFYRKLYALSDNALITVDSFQLPSACCCSYKKDFDFLRRFGVDAVTSIFDEASDV